MLRLKDLIQALETAHQKYGNIEYDISAVDEKNREIHGSVLPDIQFKEDKTDGDWINIEFKGKFLDVGE